MLTNGNMDGKVVTKERIVCGCPGTGAGEGWGRGCDVRSGVVMCVVSCRKCVSASVKGNHVQSVEEVVDKCAGWIGSKVGVPKGVVSINISAEEDRSSDCLEKGS